MMLIDVTRPLYSGMPRAHTLPEVEISSLRRLADGSEVETAMLRIPSHAGTHVDAPSHVIEGGRTIDQLAVDRFVGPGVVTSVRKEPGGLIEIDDVVSGGPAIDRGDMVFLDTGWGEKFGTAAYYDHPSLSVELANWFVSTGVSLVACDFPTPDLAIPRRGKNFDFPVHHAMLGGDVLIAENLGPLSPTAGKRVTAFAFPLIVQGGDAGHARIVLEI